MARRSGRPGAWLMSDDYYGFTRYSNQLSRDYWNNYAQKPLKRNLQELAVSLSDPYPVYPVQAPSYEVTANVSALVNAPAKVGLTNVNTNRDNMAIQGGVVK